MSTAKSNLYYLLGPSEIAMYINQIAVDVAPDYQSFQIGLYREWEFFKIFPLLEVYTYTCSFSLANNSQEESVQHGILEITLKTVQKKDTQLANNIHCLNQQHCYHKVKSL